MINRIVLIAYMLIILISSLIPSDESIPYNFLIRMDSSLQNFLHIPAYAILTFLWMNAFYDVPKQMKHIFFAFLMATAFGIANEFIQIMIPGRYFSVPDMVFNGVGALSGILIHCLCIKNKSVHAK